MNDVICNTCGKPDYAPYRQWEGDRIRFGCVDACHTGRLVSPSQSNSWHCRPEAKKIRSDSARRLKELLRK